MRNCDLQTISCQKKLSQSTALSGEIAGHAFALFRERYRWDRPIRSIGVCVSELECADAPRQICMFADVRRMRCYALEKAVEDIRRRFGHYAIGRASLLSDAKLNGINPKDEHVIFPAGWRR